MYQNYTYVHFNKHLNTRWGHWLNTSPTGTNWYSRTGFQSRKHGICGENCDHFKHTSGFIILTRILCRQTGWFHRTIVAGSAYLSRFFRLTIFRFLSGNPRQYITCRVLLLFLFYFSMWNLSGFQHLSFSLLLRYVVLGRVEDERPVCRFLAEVILEFREGRNPGIRSRGLY